MKSRQKNARKRKLGKKRERDRSINVNQNHLSLSLSPTRIWFTAPISYPGQVEDEVEKSVATAKKRHGLVDDDEEAKEIRLYDYDARLCTRMHAAYDGI